MYAHGNRFAVVRLGGVMRSNLKFDAGAREYATSCPLRLLCCSFRSGAREPPLRSTKFSIASSLVIERRFISWNPLTWGRTDLGRSSSSISVVEKALSDIFTEESVEVEDYISPEKSLFERLEDLWDWLLSFLQPIEKQISILRSVHENGFLGSNPVQEWGTVLLLYGMVIRFLTLIPSLYSHRNSLRMGRIGSQLSEISNAENKAKNDRTLTSAEKRALKEGYSRMKHALYTRGQCAQWKSFGAAISAPVTASAFLAIRRLALYESDLQNISFLWIKDLSLPDPTYTLPLLCGVLFLFNFELNQKMQKGGRSSGTLFIRWGTRAGAVVGVYCLSSQPAALFSYWIGLSCIGMLQPLLLRWQPFREMFKFPDPPEAAKANIVDLSRKKSCDVGKWFNRGGVPEAKVQKTSENAEGKLAFGGIAFERIEDYKVVFDVGNDQRNKK